MIIFIRFKNLRALVFIIVCLFGMESGFAQSQDFYNKLKQADSLLNSGQIQEAIQDLSLLDSQVEANEDLVRLLGKAHYWSDDFEKTKTFFRQKLDNNPDFLQAQLDFARILYELQEWEESEQLLETLIIRLPNDPEVNQKLAEINYWTGGSKSTSLKYLENILNQYPENPSALSLREEINLTTAPMLVIKSGFYSDSQPMNYGLIGAEISFYQSSKLQPVLSVESRFYKESQVITQFQVKNKFGFFSNKTSLTLTAGAVQNQNWDNTLSTYSGTLAQNLGKEFVAKAIFAKEAYLYTLASLEEPISPRLLSFSFSRESKNSWIGNFQLDQRTFEGFNRLRSGSIWFLVPIIRSSKFDVQLGYSGSMSDTDSVRFEPESNLRIPGLSPKFGLLIPGSYDPYFTPINQSIHGVLGKISFRPQTTQTINLTANYGFFAEIDNPNIYYFGPEKIVPSPINPTDLFLLFNTESYHPLDFKAEYANEFSKKTSLHFSYQYQKTIFFDSHFIQLSFTKKL